MYLLIQKDNQTSSKYLAATLIAYVFAIFSMIFYLSKDVYYYNIVNNYFSLPKVIWKYLMFVNIPKDIIIRMLNFSSLAVIFFGYNFSISYRKKLTPHKMDFFRFILLTILLVEFIAYDPDIRYRVYLFAYPGLMTLQQIEIFRKVFHIATVTLNMGFIVMSVVQLCLTYKKVYFLRFLRSYLIGEGVCYTLIMLSYVIIFWFSPASLIKTSKVADFVIYLSVPLSDNLIIYTAYPYYLIITTLLCAFCIYELAGIKKRMKKKDFTITKQIDAADTTSKIFCHYMKNELLAIQSEIELLQVSGENDGGIRDLLSRCDHLYQRLDMIHRSTRTSKLNLIETDITKFISDILKQMKCDLHNCHVVTNFEKDIAKVMLDPIYFEQAVKNILENALDSMETVPVPQRKIIISLQSVSNWIILSIQDAGIGIPESSMKDIFTPLYSSKPIAKHWGIGLALTHRIIMAHEGKIEVESHEKAGTNFKIFLPDMNKYIS
jgi:signal transduction histidine kinase